MRIGMIAPYDWNYPGGVREHVRHLTAEFMKMGQEVHILAPASRMEDPLAEGNISNMGGTVPLPINGSIARISLHPLLGSTVRQVLQREQFDVMHFHEPLLPGFSWLALRFSRALTVGAFHAYARFAPLSTPALAYACSRPLLRPSFHRLNGRIAVSLAAYRFVSRFFEGDYRIIPNGVDLDTFHPFVPPFPHLMDGKCNVLFVGRLEKRKGATYLLNALPAIRAQCPETRFLFVGEGSLRRGLQHIVKRHGWHDVLFPGYVPTEELPRYFASAHAFCAPATGGESMGVVLLEAMASGTPVVATAIEGYTTIVHDGENGLLATPRDASSLARALGHRSPTKHSVRG